jgi:methionyl aminopeptidase
MTLLKTLREKQKMKHPRKISAQALALVGEAERIGNTTAELDAIAKWFIENSGAAPSFLGYGGYPATICTSVNEQVVHGIPGSRVLQNGDIVSIDLGAIYKGYHGDNAKTYAVGQISKQAQRLIDVTEQAFYAGMQAFETCNRLQSVSAAVQETAESAGFSVVRELVGHGIGQQLHEEPNVPNFVTGNKGPRLRVGMVLAIEPMINMGGKETYTLSDGWTVCTSDNSMSSHYEHTVALTQGGPEILTKG